MLYVHVRARLLQMVTHNHMLVAMHGRSAVVALVDVDEYLFTPQPTMLAQVCVRACVRACVGVGANGSPGQGAWTQAVGCAKTRVTVPPPLLSGRLQRPCSKTPSTSASDRLAG